MTPFEPVLTDAAILTHLGERIARRRLERNVSQAQLARDAGVSTRTIVRLEDGNSTQLTVFIRVLRALQLQNELLELIPDQQPSPLEKLREKRATRRRASRRSNPTTDATDKPWAWGDEQNGATS